MAAQVFALQFQDRLKTHSQNKEDPVSEWELLDEIVYSTTHCLCGKEIHVVYQIQNKLTREVIGIGSECVKRWLDSSLYCKCCQCSLGNALQRRREKKFYCRQCRAYLENQGNCLFWHNHRIYQLKEIIKDVPLLEEILNSDNMKKKLLLNYAKHFFEFEQIEI
jgi:hypothetical protein